MLVQHSFDQRFVNKIEELRKKYGEEIFNIEGIGISKLDINEYGKKFFKNNTTNITAITVDQNANVEDDSVFSFYYEFNKGIQKLNALYLLWKKMIENGHDIKRANKTLELIINGTLKVHDLQFFLIPYCNGFSLMPLIENGMKFIRKVKIDPCKHLSSFINHVIQFTAYCSNQIAGAAAYPDFFIYFDYFARKDYGENYLQTNTTKIKQELQSLIFSLNYPYRGTQSSFTNLSVYDKYFLESLFSDFVYPDESKVDFNSVKKLQEFYIKWFVENSKEQTFTFPVNTATFYKNEDGEILDKEFLDYISEYNAVNGTFNIFTGELGTLSSCCRLRNDSKKLYTNSFGAGGISIGSHRVVTINLPHIAYESETELEFLTSLENKISYMQDILDTHRKLIQEMIDRKKLPLYNHGFINLNKQFSTLGFIGMNECCEIIGLNINSDSGIKFCKSILNMMNKMNEDRTKIDGYIRNIEQIPGESAAIDFAKKDKLQFVNQEFKMYSNQYIPLTKNVDIHDRIQMQGKFDSECSGGAICHINVSDSLTKNQMRSIIEYAAKEGCIYFAINIAQCRCKQCDKLYIGKFEKSPCCNSDVIKYLRVVGFLTPVENWIQERQEEYEHRQFYESLNL